MTEFAFDTERERYAIGVLRDALKDVHYALIDRIAALESGPEERDEVTTDKISILKLRLDALLKIENKLIDKLVNEYIELEKTFAEGKKPNAIEKIERRQHELIDAFLQGT